MRTTVRWACVAVPTLLLALLLAATAAPAAAKGPTDVKVSGPGVEAAFGWTDRGDDVDVGTLSEAARITHHWDGSGLGPSPALTPDQLGPRYVLTWTVGRSPWAVQHAYPFADGGAWVRFLSVPGGGPGGWARAPALERQLDALGTGAEPQDPAADSPDPAPAVAAPDDADDAVDAADTAGAAEPASKDDPAWLYDAVVPAVVLLALAVLVGWVLVARRRRLGRGRALR